VGVIILVALTAADAASLKRIDSKDGKTRIELSGEITSGDADRFKALITEANQQKRVVATVFLNSTGGSLGEGVEIAAAVKYGRIATSVKSDHVCASACFLIFAAGSERFANHSARIGVHGASDRNGREAGDATVLMSRALRELGVPPAILGKLVVTPPSEIFWLTLDDLRSMSVTMFGRPKQTVSSSDPLQLSPQNSIPQQVEPNTQSPVQQATESKADWRTVVRNAFDISAKQNDGKPRTARSCQPEYKRCYTAIFFTSVKDESDVMIRTTEDMSGSIISRDICFFNAFKDVRTCTNWDTGTSSKAMKNANGDFVNID
jgi:hypothetical protein